MKRILHFLSLSLLAYPLAMPLVFGDTLILLSGRNVTGTLLQTNGDDVLFMSDYATFTYSRANIEQIKIEPSEAGGIQSTNRVPAYKTIILNLSKQPWAPHLRQIPATVIDKGMLRNVPYVSFRCGDDYEVNIYGDLDRPAGLECGVYRKLLENGSAKSNCVKFLSTLLSEAADKKLVQELNFEKDLKTSEGITFEITPPTAEDAYMGWWVSIYSEQRLNLARATDQELKNISTTKAAAIQREDASAWSAEELKLARHSAPTTISFTDRFGLVVTNAEVVRLIDGVSLIWRKGATGGVLKLADLPEQLRVLFGYDPVKAESADVAEMEKKALEAQQAQIRAVQYSTPGQDARIHAAPHTQNNISTAPSSGSRVYVRGYTKKDGTYVSAHTRSSPRRR